ncbi:MAG: hypothetical protein ABH858_06355 [Candidatus Omnitrophota bacterium]
MKTKVKISLFFTVIMIIGLLVTSAESREAEKLRITAKKYVFSDVLDNLAAVTFIGRPGEYSYRLEVEGLSGDPESAVINGYNHDIAGELIGSGDKPGISTNQDAMAVESNYITINGYPEAIQDEGGFVNVKNWVDYFARKADMVFNEDTVYDGGSIGAPSDYKVVYVDDSNLTLSGAFRGYGVLVMRDRSAQQGQVRLTMADTASWEGVVIVYQDDLDGSTEITVCSLGGSALPPGGGSIHDVGSYTILAVKTLDMDHGAAVNSGFIGVNDSGGQMYIGHHCDLNNGSSAAADNLEIDHHTTISGNVYYNTADISTNNVTIEGDRITPLDLPLVTLPDFPSFSAGSTDINKNHHSSVTINAGDYGDITVGHHSTVYLSGGTYNTNRWNIDHTCDIYFQAPCVINVADQVDIDHHVNIKPAAGSGLSAKDLVWNIAGVGSSSSTDVGFYGDHHIEVHANIYAPNAKIEFNHHGDYYGSFIAKWIEIGHNDTSNFYGDSAWGSGQQEQANVRIIGAMLLEGREFILPNELGYSQILYSQEAVNNVDALITDRGFVWEDWKRKE